MNKIVAKLSVVGVARAARHCIFLRKRVFMFAASFAISLGAQAGLQDLIDDFSSPLEQNSARAALETYNRLISDAGCVETNVIGPDDIAVEVIAGSPVTVRKPLQAPPLADDGGCTGQTLSLFTNLQEIIHTANDLSGDGPTSLSLGLDLQRLGFALRWLAGEEHAAQGSLSSEFSRGQLSGLGTRLTALRFGARGFQFAGLDAVPSKGVGASADNENYSPWGGFVNYSHSYGDKAPTQLEDAFDIEGTQVSLGVDYRLNDRWVLGAVLGFTDQEIDFDSSQSIVDGGITSDGYSLMPFFLYQRHQFFVSGSLGYQALSFDTVRAIRYPSLNPDVASTDTLALSTTDAAVWSMFAELGYTWQRGKFTFEPFANVKSSDITIDSFVEDDVNNDAFDLVVAEQNIDSLEATFGAKIQYTLTPTFGVFIPFATYEVISQNEDTPGAIDARYANVVTQGGNAGAYTQAVDNLDSRYAIYTLGFSSVIRGARQRGDGGALGGGIQAFANYKKFTGLENYRLALFSLGLRYEF